MGDGGKGAHRGKFVPGSKQTLQFYAAFSKISAMVTVFGWPSSALWYILDPTI